MQLSQLNTSDVILARSGLPARFQPQSVLACQLACNRCSPVESLTERNAATRSGAMSDGNVKEGFNGLIEGMSNVRCRKFFACRDPG